MADPFTHGYALLAGIDESQVPRWALPGVQRDLSALYDVLVHPQRCAYPPEQVRVVSGAKATQAGILDGLDWLRARVQADPDATALFYYSGHGWRDDAGAFYLLPYDVSESRLRFTALRAADLAAVVAEIRPPRLLAVLDCCHAAGMGVKGLLPEAYTAAALPPALLMGGERGIAGAKGLEALAQGRGRAVLSSSSGEQRSYMRADGTMSVFTYHLIEALTGHAAPKEGAREVLVSDVMGHVTRRVPESARAMGQEQTPDFQVSGNFPVALLLGGQGLGKGAAPPDPLGELPPAAAPGGGLSVGGNLTNTGNLVVGNQTIHGDYVGGDKVAGDKIEIGNITGSTGIAIGRGAQAIVGAQGAGGGEVARAFAALQRAVDALPEGPDKAIAQSAVRGLRIEADKGAGARVEDVRRWLGFLAQAAPEAWEIAARIFPGIG